MNQNKSKLIGTVLVVLQIVATISIVGCVDGDDASTDERADTAGERDQAVNAIDLIAPSASSTWVVSPDESCMDFFYFPPHWGVCTSTFPSPQCAPTVVAGQPCSPVGAQCFKTISSRKFRIFDCVTL